LALTPENTAWADALSHYAWGVLRQSEDASTFDEVQTQFVAALRLAPGSRALLQQAVAGWLVKGDFEALLGTVRPLADGNPEVAHLQLMVALATQAKGQPDEALAFLEAAFARQHRKAPELLRELVAMHWRQKRYDDVAGVLHRSRNQPGIKGSFSHAYASALYHHSLSARPEGVDVSERQAARHRRLALEQATKAAQRIGLDSEAKDIDSLFEVFADCEEWEQALAFLRAAAVEYPDLDDAIGMQQAICLRELGRDDEALERLDQIATRADPDPTLYAELGRQFIQLHEPERAAMSFTRALFLAPASERLRVTLGFVWLQLDKPQRALALLRPIRSPSPAARLLTAKAYHALRQWTDALDTLAEAETAARAAGDDEFFNVDLYLTYASIHVDAGDIDQAVEAAERAVHLEPDNPVAANFLGYVLADGNRRLDEAERLIAAAVAQDPENEAYLDSLAWVHFRQGRYAEAMAEIAHALRAGGDEPDPVILDHAGDIFSAGNCPLLASYYWWSAIQRGAANADLIRQKLRGPPFPAE